MEMQQQSLHEETVTFQGPAGRLVGTLAVPGGPVRGAVLIISGSGRQDRDGGGR